MVSLHAGQAGVDWLSEKVEQMFLGQYRHTVDDKGRLTIPARFREMMTDGAYLALGFDRNLMGLTPDAFQTFSTRVYGMSLTNPAARQLRRLFFSGATRVGADKIGRILLPSFLREKTGIDGEVMIVGVGDYFEIWSPEDWACQDALLQDADANAQRFEMFDLPTRSDE